MRNDATESYVHPDEVVICDEPRFDTSARSWAIVTRQDDQSWKIIDRSPDGDVRIAAVTLSLETIYERTEALPV